MSINNTGDSSSFWVGPYGMKVPEKYVSVPHEDGVNFIKSDGTCSKMTKKEELHQSRLEYLTKYAFYDDSTGEYWYPRPVMHLVSLSGKEFNKEQKMAISIEELAIPNNNQVYIMFTDGNQHRYWIRVGFKPYQNNQIELEPATIPDGMKCHTTYVTNHLSIGDIKYIVETTAYKIESDAEQFIKVLRNTIEQKEILKRDIAKIKEDLNSV